MSGHHFAIFGLSGVGKTTFVEAICNEAGFFQPCQTVTRKARPDDKIGKYEYVTKEVFQILRLAGEFFISDCKSDSYYGYRKKWLKEAKSFSLILYGIPSKLQKTILLGGICILIIGDAAKGLQLRNDPENLRTRRTELNQVLQTQYYGNPVFLEKMDLILTNEFGHIDKLTSIYKAFVRFKNAEMGLVNEGNRRHKLLSDVLKVYHHPLPGMRYDFTKHQWYVHLALNDKILASNFYSNLIRASICFFELIKQTRDFPMFRLASMLHRPLGIGTLQQKRAAIVPHSKSLSANILNQIKESSSQSAVEKGYRFLIHNCSVKRLSTPC